MRQRHPFTFLELMIATAILSMVAAGLFVYSQNVSKSWQQIIRERNRMLEITTLDRTIDAVLANAVPFIWRDDGDEENETFPFIVADPAGLRIAYLHTIHDEIEGAIRFAEFVLQDGELYLQYSDRPFYDWSQAAERTQRVLLAEGIDELQFLYLDWSDADDDWQNRALWLDQWETEDSGRTDIPLAIMMKVTWNDGHSHTWLRRTMGNSFRERYGKWNPLEEDKR
ncbi:MAG: prepilin-type N-terminal cleavage/methylation domain-containing protein [Victivallales bacterium]|nr:prepilin-type N-terminal cleavage/methylation domain-containing protein [Victivallales bacterium]